MEDSGCRFDKFSSKTIYFFETNEMNGSYYVKFPLRCSGILNIDNDDKFCFVWAIFVSAHPSGNYHPIRVSNIETILMNEAFKVLISQKDSSVVMFTKLKN